MDKVRLIQEVSARYTHDCHLSLHGVHHWQRVETVGLAIARQCGADPLVVQLFAWLHDACRLNEHVDNGHGLRGAELAGRLRGKVFNLDDGAFSLLYEACADHTAGRTTTEVTIGTCWDADRLDLSRVGIMPDPYYMSTDMGRAMATDWLDENNDFSRSDSQ